MLFAISSGAFRIFRARLDMRERGDPFGGLRVDPQLREQRIVVLGLVDRLRFREAAGEQMKLIERG